MRTIPAGLAGRLAAGATTLCFCWKLVRHDGVVLGFTDHDRDLVLDGITYAAGTGLDAAETTAELGFAVGGGEVVGALVAASISEQDLAAGRFDDAAVETWLVDWQSPTERLLVDIAWTGEIRRADGAFVAELRGLGHRLDQERGRLYGSTCAADLGDARCGIDLAEPAFTAEASVSAACGSAGLTSADLGAYAQGWFAGGGLTFTSGANQGLGFEVRGHRRGDSLAELDLWQPPPAPIAVGDGFRVTAGCDKRLQTCRAKFGNVVNFRGFPHMPGNDFILRVARQGEAGLDGGSLFR